MGKVFFGVVLGVALVAGAGYLFVKGGHMPVAAKGRALPLERWVARVSIDAAIGKEAERPSPVPADEANLLAGVKVYRANCEVCHGLPEKPPSAIAKGLFPKAPQLFPPRKGVTDDPVGETFWKAKNGIRLTGMPGFSESLGDTDLWQVSQLLFKADQLPPSVLAALK